MWGQKWAESFDPQKGSSSQSSAAPAVLGALGALVLL